MIDFVGRCRCLCLATPQFGKSENEAFQGLFTPCASAFQPRTRHESASFSLAQLPLARLRGKPTPFSHTAIFTRNRTPTHCGRIAPTETHDVRVMFDTPQTKRTRHEQP